MKECRTCKHYNKPQGICLKYMSARHQSDGKGCQFYEPEG
jgi:hypothetical protein